MSSKIISRTAFDGLAVDEGEESDVEELEQELLAPPPAEPYVTLF